MRRQYFHYRPRPQFRAFHRRKERFACIVTHRRAGKTVACIHCPSPTPCTTGPPTRAAATDTRLTEPLDSLLLKLWRPTIICRRQYPAWCGSAEARGTKVTSADQLEGMDVGKFAILFISGGKFTGNQ